MCYKESFSTQEKLIFTDASNAGWGAHLDNDSTGGVWSPTEKHLHINLLEMKAVLLALRFFKQLSGIIVF